MKYFTAIWFGKEAKNKAQRECCQLYGNHNYDNILINSDEQCNSLVCDLIQKVNDINKNNPRCADVKTARGYCDGSFSFNVGDLFFLKIYKVKKEI